MKIEFLKECTSPDGTIYRVQGVADVADTVATSLIARTWAKASGVEDASGWKLNVPPPPTEPEKKFHTKCIRFLSNMGSPPRLGHADGIQANAGAVMDVEVSFADSLLAAGVAMVPHDTDPGTWRDAGKIDLARKRIELERRVSNIS